MTTKKTTSPSFLEGRTIGRKNAALELGTEAQQRLETIQQEVEAVTDFRSIPLTPLEKIDPNPHQPRRKMQETKLEELAQNMRQYGITSAIVGRRRGDRIQIAYGHRRVKAAEKAGYGGYPVLIKDLTDWDMRYLAIGENRFREDLTPLEEGYLFQELLEAGLTQEEVAAFYQVSRGYLRERMELPKDDEDIQQMVVTRPDTVRAARDLRKEDDRQIRATVIEALLEEKITGAHVAAYLETLRKEKQRLVSPDEDTRQKKPRQTPSDGQHARDIPSETQERHLAGSQDWIQRAKLKSSELVEQNKLHTLYKQMTAYGIRLDQRLRQGSISQEERKLLESIHQMVTSQVEKVQEHS